MELVIILLIMAGVFFSLDLLLRRCLGVKKARLSDTPAKRIDLWGRVIILFVLLSVFPSAEEANDTDKFLWFFSVTLLTMSAFQAYLQWRYIKESKEHIVTLLVAPIGLAILFLVASFF